MLTSVKIYSLKGFSFFTLQYLFFINLVFGQNECIHNSHIEYFKNCGGCGICFTVPDGKKDKHVCVYDIMAKFNLTQYFNSESGKRCELTNFCESEESKSKCKKYPCVPFLGTYKCKCDPTKFGRLCQNEVKPGLSYQDYAVVENVLYTPEFSFEEYLTISILFSYLGRRNFEVHVETVLERNVYDLKRVEPIVFDEQYCKTLYPINHKFCTSKNFNFKSVKWILNIRLFYPGREFKKNRPYLPAGNTTQDIEDGLFIGKKETVKIFIYSNKDINPVYDNTFTVPDYLLSPRFSPCEPFVTIRQGSDTVFDIVKFAKRNELIIANFFMIPVTYREGIPEVCFKSLKDFTIRWRAWKYGLNHDESTTEPLLSRINVPNIIFNAYSLEIGQYKVRNNVTLLDRSQEGFSATYSYFEIIKLELEVLIQGGDVKNVYYKTKHLSLNASTSNNPNLSHLEKNEDLLFNWKCDKCSKGYSNGSTITYHGPFQNNQLYTFTLTIASKMYTSTKTTFQKILMASDAIPTLDIFCKKNCKFQGFQSNPSEVIYLQVILSYPDKTEQDSKVKPTNKFTWTYSTDEGKSYVSVETIRQPNAPSDVLIVQQNTLTAGMNYVFRVESGVEVSGRAEFNIHMAKTAQTKNFTCNLDPPHENGAYTGYFKYKIICDRLIIDKLSPKYEFYDQYSDREDLGRLLTSGCANIAKYVAITRGKLVIEVTDRWGALMYTFEIKRKIKYNEPSKILVKEAFDFLNIFHTTIDPEYSANAFSMIADLISSDKKQFYENGNTIIKDLLEKASYKDIYSYISMKLWANSMNIIADLGLELGLDSDDVYNLSKVILKLTEKFLDTLKKSYDVLHEFTTREILQVSQMIINSCNVVYLSRNSDLENGFVRKEDMYRVYSNYRESVLNIIFSIHEVLQTLSVTTLPHLSPLRVMSKNITIWIKEDTPNSFIQSSNQTQNRSIPSVQITHDLANFLHRLSEIVIVKVIVYNGNPFWWDTDLKIITNVVSLEIKENKNTEQVIEVLHKPVRIYLDLLQPGETIIAGSVQQPDPHGSFDKADKQVNVYKIRVEDHSALRLTFHNLTDGETVRVQLFRNLRPDYNYTKSGKIITKSNPEYHKVLREPNSVDIYDFDFLGILPGSEVPVGQRQNYNFSISIMHCASWEPVHGWSSRACDAKGIDSETKQLVCECKHLSSFAGFSSAPKNVLNPFHGFELILEINDNPFIVVFIICLFLSYFLLLFLAFWKRKRDRQFVIYLEDNMPHDKFPYLIVVFTGCRLLTGTTSNVGIAVEGDDSVSRPHILTSSRYKTLQRGDDNWFIMYTPYYLGKINMIQLWMDYSGRRPEWYLYKIIIIDITTGVQYKFLIDDWLSLRFGNYIERFEKVHDDKETKRKDLVDEDLAIGFREAHLWFSALSTHPRSALTRSERLSVAFCGLFVVMLVSCIFYGVLDEAQEESSEFSVTQKQVIVGAIGLFVVIVFIGFVITVFRASLKVQYPLTHDKTHRSNPIFRFCHLLRTILSRKKKFVPAHCGLDIVKSEKYINTYTNPKFKYLAWCICTSLILVCSFFTIMYAIKFGKVKFLEWLSSIVLSLTLDIFLVSPLKIVLYTAISMMTFSTIYGLINYDIDWKRVKIHKKHLLDADPEIEVNLVKARSKKIYVPLSYREAMIKHHREYLFEDLWLLLDVLVIAVLAVMLIIQSNTLWTTKFYWNNYELVSLLKRGYKNEGYKESEIKNVSNYLPSLKKNVFPLIYQAQWYNRLPLKESGSEQSSLSFTFNGAGTLLGVPRIRQIRLKPGLCRKSIYNGLPNVCSSMITEETRDTAIYWEGWKSNGSSEILQKSSVWVYRNASETCDKVVFGYSALKYDAGGYVAHLGQTQPRSEFIIHYLQIENWLDRQTAAIIFELTIYNPNAGTISWLIAITERLHIGLLLNKMYVYTTDQQYNVFVIDTVVFISMFAFIVRLLLVLNRRGIQHLLFDFWNRFEIMIALLNIYCAILYIKNIYNMKKYLKEYYERETKVYFEFLNLIDILTDIEVVFVVMFLMVMCRFMKSWGFSRVFDILFSTLLEMLKCIIWVFILICLLIFFYWKNISYLLNEFVFSRTFFLFINKLDFKVTVRECQSPSCKVSLYMSCMLSDCLLLLLLINCLWSYRTIKNRAAGKEEFDLGEGFLQNKKAKSPFVHRR